MVHVAWCFDSFKPVLSPYPILVPEHPSLLWVIWNLLGILSDTHRRCTPVHCPSHMQSSVVIPSGVTVRASQTREANKRTPVGGEGKFVAVKTFSVDTYTKEEIIVFIGQILRLETSAGRHQVSRPDSLLILICNDAFVRRIMSDALNAHGISDDTNYLSMLDSIDIFRNLREGYVLATMNWWHRCSCVLQLFAKARSTLGTRPPECRTHLKAGKEAIEHLRGHTLSQGANICSALVCPDTFFVEVARVLTYSHTFAWAFSWPFLREKNSEYCARHDVVWLSPLNELLAKTTIRSHQKSTLKHSRVLDIVTQLNERFPSN